MPPPSTIPIARKRKVPDITDSVNGTGAGSPSSSASSSTASPDMDIDEEYEPSPGPSTRVARAGGKSKRASGGNSKNGAGSSGKAGGAGSGGGGRPLSREALRKANHSLIERRRREKINFALSELREMVPGLGDGLSKGGEFKLEVLERTVVYMRQLRQSVVDLEGQLGVPLSIPGLQPSAEFTQKSNIKYEEDLHEDQASSSRPHKRKSYHHPQHHHHKSSSSSPPTPIPSAPPSEATETPSVDPNETDVEPSLPPPLTVAHRSPSSSYSIPIPGNTPTLPALLSNGANGLSNRTILPPPPSRPIAPPQANNPTLYLPFPTPSPTSPFLTYSSSGMSCSSVGALTEPSPFLAPLQNIGLFGGVLNLDNSTDSSSSSAEDGTGKPVKVTAQDTSTEEAANLLLAFSSPDTLRPSNTSTPMVIPSGRERRSTLESEEFTLDGNGNTSHERGLAAVDRSVKGLVAGKTARDILRM